MGATPASSRRLGIVVGVDGSPQSHAAVDWAARDAVLRGVPLTVVHVMPTATMLSWIDAPLDAGYWAQRDRHAEKIVGEALAWVAESITATPPIPVSHRLATAPFVPALVELSAEAEVMVVGCRGLGGVSGLLLGSVSTGLIHRANCPVAVVHDEDPTLTYPSLAPVVVGIDGSPASESATAIAFDEASRRGVELHAVHVWIDHTDDFVDGYWGNLDEWAQETLSERLAGWAERRPEVTVRQFVEKDHPARRLLAHGAGAQLLVVGSHGRGGPTRALLGSVSTAVAHGARRPVLVARGS